ncbi:MAG: hypothetical protein DRI24_24635 [Deltaproteobacteria bacterium]|nr:MAG: hypothetical protein DRI24_24635 [Deltaproteobacteria bacterium]
MKFWIGKSIVFIGLLHTLVGVFGFYGTLCELVDEKVFNTVCGQPDRELTFWFIAFGLLTIVFGVFVDSYERTFTRFPRRLGWGLFLFAAVIVVALPVSGAWLFLIPAAGAIHHSGRRG